jgi:hypothetical protein
MRQKGLSYSTLHELPVGLTPEDPTKEAALMIRVDLDPSADGAYPDTIRIRFSKSGEVVECLSGKANQYEHSYDCDNYSEGHTGWARFLGRHPIQLSSGDQDFEGQ